MPLLVADAAHRLQLRLVGVPLIPVAKLAPLEHVLAPAVAGELVAHPPAENNSEVRRVPPESLKAL